VRCKDVHLARQRLEQALRDLACIDRKNDVPSQGDGAAVRGTRVCGRNRVCALGPPLGESVGELRSGSLFRDIAASGDGNDQEHERSARH
jgi:hypothetical protein